MKRISLLRTSLIASIFAFGLMSSAVRAESYVYAAGAGAPNGQIFGFSVNETTGALTALTPGFPVDTGAAFSTGIRPYHMCYDSVNQRLFVLNTPGQTARVYSINLLTGALTSLYTINLGAPLGNWVTILVHPSGSPLLIGDAGGRVASYIITGTSATQAAGSPFTTTVSASGVALSADGNFYYSGAGTNGSPVAGFSVNAATGVLTALAGSPFSGFGTGLFTAAATDAAGRIFSGSIGTIELRAFRTTAGIPTAVVGNPFTGSNTSPSFGLVHPSGYYVFSDDTANTVNVYKISSGGMTPSGALSPVGFLSSSGTGTNVIAVNNAGTFVFALNANSHNISTFTFNTATGALGSPVVQPANTLGTNQLSGLAYAFGQTPTVTAITPDFDALAGGKQTVISGMGFVNGTTVTIGGKPASVVSTTSTAITVVVPSGTTIGYVDVVLTIPGFSTPITKSQFFYYDTEPIGQAQTLATNAGAPLSGTLTATHPGTFPLIEFKIVTAPRKGTVSIPAATLTNKASTGTAVTVTTSAPHGFSVGQTVVVFCKPFDSNIDNATALITAVPTPTTFTYAKTATAVASTATAGSAQRITNTLPATGGVAASIPFTYTPNAGANNSTAPAGPDTFTFSVSDGLLDSIPVTVTVNIADLPPTITIFNSSQNPSFPGALAQFIFAATDPENSTLVAVLNFGDGSAPATGVINGQVGAVHIFPASGGTFTVTLTVSDGANQVSQSITQVVGTPSSTGAGVPNIGQGVPPVVVPVTVQPGGLGVSVANSNGGVIQLSIDISSFPAPLEKYRVDTVVLSATGTIVVPPITGTSPVFTLVSRGIYVAYVVVTDLTTSQLVGAVRLQLTVGSQETGDAVNPTQRLWMPGDRAAAAADTSITTKSMKGKFAFGAAKNDTVTYTGTIKVPAGITIGEPHEFWVGIGNILVKTTLDKSGKGSTPGTPAVLKSLKLSLKGKKGTVTTGGESATVTISYSTKNMVANGFDTEGVSKQSIDTAGGKKAPRSIQLSMLLDGFPFQAQVPVDFSMSKDSEFGSILSRKAK